MMESTALLVSMAHMQYSISLQRPRAWFSSITPSMRGGRGSLGRKFEDAHFDTKTNLGLVLGTNSRKLKGLVGIRIYDGIGSRSNAHEFHENGAAAVSSVCSEGFSSRQEGDGSATSMEESEDDAEPLLAEKCMENGSSTRPSQGGELRAFLAGSWARVQVMGLLAVVAFGIGASAASASVLGLKPSRGKPLPCFATVSSMLDKDQTVKKAQGAEPAAAAPENSIKAEEGRQDGDVGGGQSGSRKEHPADAKGSVVSDTGVSEKRDRIVGEEDEIDEDDDEEEDEDEEDEESDVDVDDDEETRYPTLGDIEDLDELGELASGAAAAELLSGSGEIESAETGGENRLGGSGEQFDPDDEDLDKAYEEWKSKPYALTVPLRIVSLRGSVPPIWLKEFLMSQGKNAKLAVEFKGSLSDILADLASSMEKKRLTPRSAMAADLVTVGDSWLATAVQGGLIEPIMNAEQFDWFNRLHPKWQNFLRRDPEGVLNPQGPVWGIPYRWGSLVIAYRRDKLEKNGVGPIKDWPDLWKPELAGRVAMVDSPREVVGAVLKSLGASYNTSDFEKEVPGGRAAVKDQFEALQKQVRLFDDVDYLKAMGAGDVWVAVGWSSDVIPFAKRTSNISVIAPESGTSLWADLWAIPATTTFSTAENVGGRVRGPSPLVFQWLDFCLQPARAATFKNDVFVGASPLYLSENSEGEAPKADAETADKPGTEAGVLKTEKQQANAVTGIETNIVEGMPPQDIVAKSEFLEPLSEEAILDYQWLLSAPIDVQGWPSGLIGFFKGSYQGCLRWARERGIRT